MQSRHRTFQLSISNAAARAVENGHPWIFGEGSGLPPVGKPLELVRQGGGVVGWGLVDSGSINVRVLGKGRFPEGGIQATLDERMLRADRFRFRMIQGATDTYRVISGAGDGLPGIVVDRYGGLAVLRVYSSAWESYIQGVVRALERLPWVESVWRKFGVERVDGKQGGELLFGPQPQSPLVVQEQGIKYLMRPEVGQKTGLFLDQRFHRDLVRQWAGGRCLANLFAYTGGFSVAAALGGASRVATVDIAPHAVSDARENFRLNDVDPAAHIFEVADAFEWQSREQLDMVVVDPPSLVKQKKQIASGLRAYRSLHRRVGGWLPRDGLLVTSSCTALVGLKEWMDAVGEGVNRQGEWSWHWTSGQPLDHPFSCGHPEAMYLKFGLLRKR